MCVLTLSIIFARLSKACFDPEREICKSDGIIYNYCGEPVVFTIKSAASKRSGKWTVIKPSFSHKVKNRVILQLFNTIFAHESAYINLSP
jgi:hypothetical protein